MLTTFEVHKTMSFWSSVTAGDCDSRQCDLSNMTLKMSVLNKNNTVKMRKTVKKPLMCKMELKVLESGQEDREWRWEET